MKKVDPELTQVRSERAFAADSRRTTRRTKKTPIRDAGDNGSSHGEVVTMTVSQEVWAKALELANGDVKRLQRLSETEVVVMNR